MKKFKNLQSFEDFSLNENNEKREVIKIKIVSDFFNKVAEEIGKKYFPDVKYYRDNKDCADAHYAIELFNNGMIEYDSLIKKLSKSCKDTIGNIDRIVSKYIEFEMED